MVWAFVRPACAALRRSTSQKSPFCMKSPLLLPCTHAPGCRTQPARRAALARPPSPKSQFAWTAIPLAALRWQQQPRSATPLQKQSRSNSAFSCPCSATSRDFCSGSKHVGSTSPPAATPQSHAPSAAVWAVTLLHSCHTHGGCDQEYLSPPLPPQVFHQSQL